MKRTIIYIIQYLLAAIIPSGIAYLIGSFGVLSWNVTDWEAGARCFAGIMAAITSFVCIGLITDKLMSKD